MHIPEYEKQIEASYSRQSEENYKDSSSEDEETVKRKNLEEKKADLKKMKSGMLGILIISYSCAQFYEER